MTARRKIAKVISETIETYALGGTLVSCRVRRNARAKYARITILPDRAIVVTLPIRAPKELARRIIGDKFAWITRTVADLERRTARIGRVAYPPFTKVKAYALAFARERVRHFNAEYDHPHRSIAVRDQKTRWGSCSSGGRLNFNYRVAYLPPALADYVIVHELCHLKELNHSARFWALVARAIPNHREIRRALRDYRIA